MKGMVCPSCGAGITSIPEPKADIGEFAYTVCPVCWLAGRPYEFATQVLDIGRYEEGGEYDPNTVH